LYPGGAFPEFAVQVDIRHIQRSGAHAVADEKYDVFCFLVFAENIKIVFTGYGIERTDECRTQRSQCTVPEKFPSVHIEKFIFKDIKKGMCIMLIWFDEKVNNQKGLSLLVTIYLIF
jgi:hypothetical protein